LLVKKLFESYSGVANIVVMLLSQFYALLVVEGQLVDAVRAGGYTKQLEETDHRLDRALAGLSIAIEAELHHPDANIVKAAERLRILMKAFRGEIERKVYKEESGAVKVLVVDLQGAYAPHSVLSTSALGTIKFYLYFYSTKIQLIPSLSYFYSSIFFKSPPIYA
jgi:hypothetical protein